MSAVIAILDLCVLSCELFSLQYKQEFDDKKLLDCLA